jgi:hypothetical protein
LERVRQLSVKVWRSGHRPGRIDEVPELQRERA